MDQETQRLIDNLHTETHSLRQQNKDLSTIIGEYGNQTPAQQISLRFTYGEDCEFSFLATREDLEDPAVKTVLTHGCNLLDLTISAQKAKLSTEPS